jgi:DNA-binding transcriptional LysR family regulator
LIFKEKQMNWDDLRLFLEVARSTRLVEAARRLGIDHSTLSRRLRRFEATLGTQLLERNNQGCVLTPHGYRLLEYAESIENTLHLATEQLAGHDQRLFGQVRLGATEGFGTFVLAPWLADFCDLHPLISVDLLPVPRFVNLAKHEADLAISVERPQTGNYLLTKLTDYRLKLYATPDYLAQHPPLTSLRDLTQHRFIGYINDLVFSAELRYLEQIAPGATVNVRSTSVVAQYMAARRGLGLAVLPCFLAHQSPDLVPVLEGEIDLVRSLWMIAPTERRPIARVAALWDALRASADDNHAFMMGDTRQMAGLRGAHTAPNTVL